MERILEAICHDGHLILLERLPASMEGKKIKLMLMEDDDLEAKKTNFLASVDKSSFQLPEDYQFNRDDIYER